ncbi:hypothetical protein AB0M05_41400 [Streptomyces violaceusniger]|uniref:hypothetical protein n=1 Tax=Streptomyces violaceusniger TaxID=68280 RepID=UPI0034465170
MSAPGRTAGKRRPSRAAGSSTAPDPILGTGRVTLARTGGGAGPGWGAYILLYTSQPQPDGGRAAIIATTAPDHPDLNPAWGLHRPATRYADPDTATRPLWDYAAAANTPQGREAADRYELRLALYLLGTALAPRLVPRPTAVDLPAAAWEIAPYRTIHLPPGANAGHTAVRIGRLVTLTPKES